MRDGEEAPIPAVDDEPIASTFAVPASRKARPNRGNCEPRRALALGGAGSAVAAGTLSLGRGHTGELVARHWPREGSARALVSSKVEKGICNTSAS